MPPARILIADDHAVVRKGLRALLEGRPQWKICGEAATGWEAVDKAKHLRPDLVILDISMPELNGLDATPLIVKAVPGARVLILTMHDTEEIIERVLRAGARGYVLKSDAERDLVQAVDALTRNKPFFTSVVSEIMLGSFRQDQDRAPEQPLWNGRLTPRERAVLQLLAEGRSNKEAAARLGISVRTVESHRARIMAKLGSRSLGELVRYAIRNRIVEA